MLEPVEPIQIVIEKKHLVRFVRFARQNNLPIWKPNKNTMIEKALDSPVLVEMFKTVRELATPQDEPIIIDVDVEDAEFDIPGENEDGEEEK